MATSGVVTESPDAPALWSATVREAVDRQADLRPDATYLIAPETGRILSFGGLRRACLRLAGWLRRQGCRPGDKLALYAPNGLQTCRLFVGAMYGGYCAAPLNLLAQPAQLQYVLGHCDARIVFAAAEEVPRLEAACRGVARVIRVVAFDPDAEEFLDDAQTAASPAEIGAEDDAILLYTSGTTGRPKGVLLSHRAVVAGGRFVSQAHRLGCDDRVMACLPLYHINGEIVTAVAPLLHGGSLVLPRRFSATAFWQQTARWRCTWANVVPTIIAYLLAGPDPPGDFERGRLRFCRSASAPLPPSQQRDFEERFGISVIETMGLTETAAPAFTNPLDRALRKRGSPGRAFGNEAKIVDAEGRALPPGMAGEILVRGLNVMKGYYKDAEETARTLDSDGWLHTGDIGVFDEDGYVFVTGRIKELIIKAGENIAPREIDEALIRHPAVSEAASVGIPDEHYGQDIMACVVLRPDAPCAEEELREFCLRELGPFKTPRLFRFVAELPKGPSGKVQRLKLLALLDSHCEVRGATGAVR